MGLIGKLERGEISHIILDCDGTLYYEEDKPFVERRVYAQLRLLSAAFAEKLLPGSNGLEIVDSLVAQHRGQRLSEVITTAYGLDLDAYYAETWGKLDPAPLMGDPTDVRAALEALSSHATLAMLSNAPRVWCDRVLDYIGVSALFGDRIWSGERHPRKPEEDAYLQVMRAINVLPTQCAMIGNEEQSDISVPKGLGFYTVRVNPAGSATVADESVDSLPSLVLPWNSGRESP